MIYERIPVSWTVRFVDPWCLHVSPPHQDELPVPACVRTEEVRHPRPTFRLLPGASRGFVVFRVSLLTLPRRALPHPNNQSKHQQFPPECKELASLSCVMKPLRRSRGEGRRSPREHWPVCNGQRARRFTGWEVPVFGL